MRSNARRLRWVGISVGLTFFWLLLGLTGCFDRIGGAQKLSYQAHWVGGRKFVPFGGIILAGDFETILTPQVANRNGPDIVPYVVLSGPEELRQGTSQEFKVTVALTNGLVDPRYPRLRFSTNIAYESRVELRAQETVLGVLAQAADDEPKPLLWRSPSIWNWIVAPKEHSLDKQKVLVSVYIRPITQTNWDSLPLSLGEISVSGPFGFGGFIHYAVVPFVSLVVGAIINSLASKYIEGKGQEKGAAGGPPQSNREVPPSPPPMKTQPKGRGSDSIRKKPRR